MLDRNDVFDVAHYSLQFGVEKAILKYVVSDDVEPIKTFIKQHNLSKELLKGIKISEPCERKNSEDDVIEIFKMHSNVDKKVYKIYSTQRIVRSCGYLAQMIISDDILFGNAILESGYEFINKIIEDVDQLDWGFIPEFHMLGVEEDLLSSYSDYEWPSEYRSYNWDVDGWFGQFRDYIDPSLSAIPLSLEGYVKTFRYLMEHPEQQDDYCCY